MLINQINILQTLYRVVFIPKTVADKLGASELPPVVKSWINQPPNWLQIHPIKLPQNVELGKLDPGEQDAILLAEQLNADLVILDDKFARQVAVKRGLKIIGLLGIIKDASRSGLLDLETTFGQLQDVGFWVAPSLLERLLKED
ncbi:MAG: DUF3368 domain-containing protein [Xenococcaceae cyanobacterium]